MYKVMMLVDNVEHGGVASAATSMYTAVNEHSDDIVIDFIVYEEPKPETREKYAANGSKIFVIPSVGAHPAAYMKRVYKILKENGPYTAIHMHTAYFIWLAAKAAKKAGVPNRVGHGHGSKGKSKSRIFDMLAAVGRRMNRKYCTKMFACAEKSGRWTFGKDFEFLPNLIFPDNLCAEKNDGYYDEFGIGRDTKVIGYYGVFEIEKNAAFVSDIMASFKDENVVCIAAGSGSMFDIATERTKQLGVESKIKYIGYRKDGYGLMRFFDVLVVPSFSEGMSLSILEAQMTGTPCVVSAGVPLTNDLQMGIYHVVPDYDPENWRKALLDALHEQCSLSVSERIEHLSKIGYDSKSVADKLIDSYLRHRS